MTDKSDEIRASADRVAAAIAVGGRREILLSARDHAAVMLQHSTSARDTPSLLKQITDITNALNALDSEQEPDQFAEIMKNIDW